MSAAGPRIRPHSRPDWRADLDPEDGTVSITIGIAYAVEADGLIDGSDAFVSAFFSESIRCADDEIGWSRSAAPET